MFGEGISKIGEIIDLGVDYGVIKKSGSWFSYGDRKLGQGRDAVKELFKTDTALADEIETKVREGDESARSRSSPPAPPKHSGWRPGAFRHTGAQTENEGYGLHGRRRKNHRGAVGRPAPFLYQNLQER